MDGGTVKLIGFPRSGIRVSIGEDMNVWYSHSNRAFDDPAVRIAALVAVGVSVAGCAMVGPDFETPKATVSEAWAHAEDPAVLAESEAHRDWWKNFNDPVLDALIETAYAQNLPLQIAGLRVHEARAILGFAGGNLYPQFQSASATAATIALSENAEPISNLPPDVAGAINTRFETYSFGLDAAWELDFWGRFRRGIESADANLAASIATYDDFLVTLTGEVANAYVLLRTLEERLSFAKNNVALQQRSFEIADIRFRNGLVTEIDPQLARSLLGSTKATIPELQIAIRQTKLALNLLLGMPPSDLRDILGGPGTIPTAPESVAVGIPADLLRRRPDIRQAELQAAAQSARIGIAKADLYPAFSLFGSVGYAADSGGDLVDSDSFSGLGGFGFDWKFLNYGRLRNIVRVEDARFQQLVVRYQNTVLNAAREVEDGLVNFLRAREQVDYLTESVNASRRAVALTRQQYSDGIISYTLVLDAQQFLVLNEDRLTEARGKVSRSLIATYKALGGGWQIREGKPFIPEAAKATMGERTNWGELLEPAAVEPRR